SLEWLLRQTEEPPDDGFFEGVGAIVMGATTYEWVLRNLDGPWPYTMPTWVMTHRSLALPEAVEGGGEPNIRFAQGSVADHYVEMCTATGDHDLWVMGGGDLAGQFADEGFLDEIIATRPPSSSARDARCCRGASTSNSSKSATVPPSSSPATVSSALCSKTAERVSPGPSPRRGGPTGRTHRRAISARSVIRMPGSCGTGRRFRDSMQA